MNGIHHGDISFNNLMHDFPTETSDPVGVVNDFDLATWVHHSATNNDRTGTIPFMAIDLLDGGLDHLTPRLYRHDMESFVWVLAYITVANIEYKNHAIKISPLPNLGAWFRDGDQADRDAHIMSKRYFHLQYGYIQRISGRYFQYLNAIRQVIFYWGDFHQSLQAKVNTPQPMWLTSMPIEEPATSETEKDDPLSSLKLFVTTVEKSFGEGSVQEGFAEMKRILLEAAEIPTITVQAV